MELKAESGDLTVTKGDEYPLCLENLRHYETIFYALVTVYITINGGLLAIFVSEKPQQEWVLCTARWAGALTSFVFWLTAESLLRCTYYFREHAADLEKESTHYKLYSTLREGTTRNRKWFPELRRKSWASAWKWHLGACAWRCLFAVVFVFWVCAALHFCRTCVCERVSCVATGSRQPIDWPCPQAMGQRRTVQAETLEPEGAKP